MTKEEWESLNPFRVPRTWYEAVTHGLYCGLLLAVVLIAGLFIIYW